MTEIMIQSYHVLEELKSLTAYQDLIKYNEIIKHQYKIEIEQFKIAQTQFQDVAQYGMYHPDYKEKAKQLSVAKKNLYEKKEVILYLKAEKAFNDALNAFVNAMTALISPYIQTPNEIGLFNKKHQGGCHGN